MVDPVSETGGSPMCGELGQGDGQGTPAASVSTGVLSGLAVVS